MLLIFVLVWSGESIVDHVDHVGVWSLGGSYQEVFWLDISIDITQVVKLLQSVQYL